MLDLAQTPAGMSHSEALARCANRVYTTSAGPIYLRERCPATFVEQLRPDEGLHAFARTPEREHGLLLKIASSAKSELALAYTGTGAIVGQITLAEAESWWQEAGVCREVAIEISAGWRKLGVARSLIELVGAREDLEGWILLAMGFSWHWETEQLGLHNTRYLLAPYGFVEYLTNEPNLRDDPANILLARIGKRVEQTALNQFYACLCQNPLSE